MKSLFVLLFAGMFVFNVSAQGPSAEHTLFSDIESEVISFDTKEINLGSIAQNIPASAVFTLTNHSDQPMVLTNVKGSCGCTATNYQKTPIAPGESTIIEAVYNAKKVGSFTKTVSVQTNLSDKTTYLKIKGNVTGA